MMRSIIWPEGQGHCTIYILHRQLNVSKSDVFDDLHRRPADKEFDLNRVELLELCLRRRPLSSLVRYWDITSWLSSSSSSFIITQHHHQQPNLLYTYIPRPTDSHQISYVIMSLFAGQEVDRKFATALTADWPLIFLGGHSKICHAFFGQIWPPAPLCHKMSHMAETPLSKICHRPKYNPPPRLCASHWL